MKPDFFQKTLNEFGLSPFTGVPCSVFTHFLNYITNNPDIENYLSSSEGEAMGLAGGFALSGKIPVVYMQNDGYGNVVNPLSSLQLMNNLPALLLISWRAEPGTKDAPQHKIMGDTLTDLLNIFNIPYIILEDSDESLLTSLSKAKKYFNEVKKPFAFIVKKGYFQKAENSIQEKETKENNFLELRNKYIKILNSLTTENDVLLGTTGFSGRELYQTSSHNGKFYMMGSMGCVGSIGLAIAKENPEKNIYALDGDGALLMKLGTLSTIGHYSPKNLIHICFNNSEYESTGGQATTASTTNFPEIAKACGYKSVKNIDTSSDFQKLLSGISKIEKPLFINIQIKSGTIDGLGRPKDSPETMRDNIMEFLK